VRHACSCCLDTEVQPIEGFLTCPETGHSCQVAADSPSTPNAQGLVQLVSGIGCVWGPLVRRFHVPDEDFEAARKAYEWPKKFSEVLREAGTKAAAEHRQFEAALKVRRKEFEQQIEQFVAKLAVVEGRSDIIKREVAVAEVSRLSGLQRLTLGAPSLFHAHRLHHCMAPDQC